jgi:hypothetical protein
MAHIVHRNKKVQREQLKAVPVGEHLPDGLIGIFFSKLTLGTRRLCVWLPIGDNGMRRTLANPPSFYRAKLTEAERIQVTSAKATRILHLNPRRVPRA